MWNIPLQPNSQDEIRLFNQITQCISPVENIIQFRNVGMNHNPIFTVYGKKLYTNFQLLALTDLLRNTNTAMDVYLDRVSIPEDGRGIRWPFPDYGANTDNDYRVTIRYIASGKTYAKHINPNNRSNQRIADMDIERLKIVEQSLQINKLHVIRIYKSQKQLEIITSHISDDFMQKVIAMIPALLPEIFKARNERTLCWDILKEIALNTDPEKRQQLLQRYTELNPILRDYEDLKITRLVQQLFNQRLASQRTIAEANKSNWEASEAITRTRFETYINSLQTLRDMEANQGIPEEFQEFMNYIRNHKSVKEIDVTNNKLALRIQTPLTQISEDALQHNYLRASSNTPGNIKVLFRKVFLENTYELWTEACIDMDILTGGLVRSTILGHSNTFLGQPHMMNHNCFGNHNGLIRGRYAQQDYIGAFEQIIAATRNLNFTDGTVVNRFMRDIRDNSYLKTIYDKAEQKFITFEEFSEKECNSNATNNNAGQSERENPLPF